jgi:hypothetical protein
MMYWRLGEASGITASDETGNHRDGIYRHGPHLARPGAILGDANTSVRFAHRKQVMHWFPTTRYTGPFTVEAWVRLRRIKPIATFFDTRTKRAEFSVDFKFLAQPNFPFRELGFDVGDGSRWLANGPPMPFQYTTGTWYYLALTVTATRATCYLNGAVLGSKVFSGTPLLFDQTHPVVVGDNARYVAERFNGRIDEVAVYVYALTPDQVMAHFSAGSAGHP